MENRAPERTLTSSGFCPRPSFCSCSFSRRFSASSIWRSTSAELPPLRMNSRQASVWMVKPGGTGSPALVISASPAPFPPSTSFMLPLPSARPLPKKYTYWVEISRCISGVASFIRVALSSSLTKLVWGRRPARGSPGFRPGRGSPLLSRCHHLGKIRDGRESVQQLLQQRQPLAAQLLVLHHHHHLVEECIDRRPQCRHPVQRGGVITGGPQLLYLRAHLL